MLDPETFDVGAFHTLEPALQRARRLQPRVCVLGPGLTTDGVGDTVRSLRRVFPLTDVIVWHPRISPRLVRDVLLAGAADVICDAAPDEAGRTVERVVHEQKLLPRVLENEDRDGETWRFEGLISRSQRMWDVFETCIRTAGTNASVLILGETGTGKELVARAIHSRSRRRGRFVALNCGAVPESLIDSELFGHVEGAFTGATGAKEGLFRHADGGTLFLDELGNLPLTAQLRLLRALQESAIRPVGGHKEIPVDIRVVAATSSSLMNAVGDDTFREDLLYRIDVIRLIIPPLRDRPEDVVFLFGHFAQQLADHYNVRRPDVTDGFLDAILAHDWPGNVRELENFTERLLLTKPGERLTATSFERLMRNYGEPDGTQHVQRAPAALPGEADADIDRPLQEVVASALERVERAYLEAALRANQGRVVRTAEQAGVSRRTLLRKLQAHGIDKRDFRQGG